MEQCKANQSGKDGQCIRDRFYEDARSALAYQPKLGRKHAAKPHADQ
jgi:hypothetical protein